MTGSKENQENSVIAQLDRAIRGGDHGTALEAFGAIDPGDLERATVVSYASFARRLSLPLKGLAVLHPFVRPAEKHQQVASPEEKAEYAACLIRVGIIDEALSLLGEIPEREHPQSLLFQSFAYFSRWDYLKAQEVLERYVSLNAPDRYQLLIAKANLAQALAYLEDPAAKKFVDEVLGETDQADTMLLHCNVLMLKAHLATMAGHFQIAARNLKLAQSRLSSSTSIDAFLVRKEYAILEAFQSNGSNASELEKIRNEATKRRHWESVRDCDFNLALTTSDLHLARFLYFGTPYEFYRARIRKNFPNVDIRQPFARKLGEGKAQAVDLGFSVEGKLTHNLKLGQVPHRLLAILSEDFYRPKRPMEVFSRLYPGEFYSPRYSKDRFYQACLRTRKHLKDQRIPLVISEEDGFYRLSVQAKKAVEIKIGETQPDIKAQARLTETEVLIERFIQIEGARSFTAREFAAVLEVSERSARRALLSACKLGLLSRDEKGPKTTYSLLTGSARG